MKKSAILERGLFNNIINEKNIMQNNHPYLVHLHYAFQTEQHIIFCMDFVRGGDLFYHLSRVTLFKEAPARFIVAELTLALEYLHQCCVIYRDLKPENVLIDLDGHVTLADFGFARTIRKGEVLNGIGGTPAYTAPEVIRGEDYSFGIDWWSLGVLAYELLVGHHPFDVRDPRDQFKIILSREIVYPTFLSSKAISWMKSMLDKDPKKRLGYSGSSDIKSHIWFSPIDWERLLLRKEKSPLKVKKGASLLHHFPKDDQPSSNGLPAGFKHTKKHHLSKGQHERFKHEFEDFRRDSIKSGDDPTMLLSPPHSPRSYLRQQPVPSAPHLSPNDRSENLAVNTTLSAPSLSGPNLYDGDDDDDDAIADSDDKRSRDSSRRTESLAEGSGGPPPVPTMSSDDQIVFDPTAAAAIVVSLPVESTPQRPASAEHSPFAHSSSTKSRLIPGLD